MTTDPCARERKEFDDALDVPDRVRQECEPYETGDDMQANPDGRKPDVYVKLASEYREAKADQEKRLVALIEYEQRHCRHAPASNTP